MSSPALFDPLSLPCGAVLPNRLAKAAMEENVAETNQLPGKALLNLYRQWAQGGTGLLITGNVMIDGSAMTGPGGVVLEQGNDLGPFRDWAQAGKSHGGQLWMQLNHPGRQTYAVAVSVWPPRQWRWRWAKRSALFGQPKAMDESDIAEVIRRFAESAKLAEQAGFDGVQIHAAHGYLLSQFLSPLSNQRTDWGGSVENRARLLVEVIHAVRAAVQPGFAVAVKLNSAKTFSAAALMTLTHWR